MRSTLQDDKWSVAVKTERQNMNVCYLARSNSIQTGFADI